MDLRSVCNLLLALSIAIPLLSCSAGAKQEDAPLVQDQYRLKQDREELESYRKDVVEPTKTQNDELALILGMMSSPDVLPSKVREKFNNMVSKKRQVFQKDMTKKRESYVKNEKKEREEFQKNLETEKRNFPKKATSEQRKEFYSDLESKRREFYQTLREKRDEFEADMRDQRKNFDDYIRERTTEFNQEARAYQQRYDDNKKMKEKEKEEKRKQQQMQSQSQMMPDYRQNSQFGSSASSTAGSTTMEEIQKGFKEMDQTPAEPIGSDQ